MRVRRHVRRLAAAAPVAVYDEAAGVEFFEVDVAAGDAAAGEAGRRQADRFRLVDGGQLGLREPGVELGEGGREEGGVREG